MKAWKLIEKNKFELITRDLSEMNEQNDVKIKMNRVLLTRNDHYLMNNAFDHQIILGNIGIGIVSEVFATASSRFSRMDRVVIEPFIPCNDCRFCKQSKQTFCLNKQNLGINSDGLLRDFISLPHTCLYTIPEVVSTNDAILIPTLSLALNLLDKIELEKGEHVAIFGGGILGVILACLANYYQAMPILVCTDDQSVKTAKNKNVFYTFRFDTDDVSQKIFSITGGRKCEKVIYLADDDISVSLALENCSPNGIFSVYGSHYDKIDLPMSYVIENNLTVNSVENCYGNFPTAINLLAKNIVKADDFESEQLSFANIDETLPNIEEEKFTKQNIIVKFD